MAEDKENNLTWYEDAARQGDAEAQFRCGWMYYYGEDTAADKKQALYWFEKSAE